MDESQVVVFEGVQQLIGHLFLTPPYGFWSVSVPNNYRPPTEPPQSGFEPKHHPRRASGDCQKDKSLLFGSDPGAPASSRPEQIDLLFDKANDNEPPGLPGRQPGSLRLQLVGLSLHRLCLLFKLRSVLDEGKLARHLPYALGVVPLKLSASTQLLTRTHGAILIRGMIMFAGNRGQGCSIRDRGG